MAQRTVLIQNGAHMSIRNGLLTVKTDGHILSLPLEDIWVVIVESHQTTITTACLSALVDAGIGVMICGRDHMPNGLMLPLGAHSRHAAIVDDQLAMSKPLQKQLWKRIVEAKLENQAAVLDEMGLPSERIREYSSSVRSGDSDNREAVAAAVYFEEVISDGTRRDSSMTGALDYGYGVLRAGIARAAVGGGWLVSRGIHHHNEFNAFNLVDDLMEPFRPLVDLIVLSYDIREPLEPDDKAVLCSVFRHTMVIEGKICGCEQCINVMLSSLRTAVLAKDASMLSLPELDGLHLVKIE